MLDLVFLVDDSSSMESYFDYYQCEIQSHISEFKKFLSRTHSTISVIKFNEEQRILLLNKPLNDFEEMPEDYQPEGRTGLYDAIINTLKNRKQLNKHVCFVIVADGSDNCSVHARRDVISAIDYHKSRSHEFIFIGITQNAVDEGNRLEIDNVIECSIYEESIVEGFNTMGGMVEKIIYDLEHINIEDDLEDDLEEMCI